MKGFIKQIKSIIKRIKSGELRKFVKEMRWVFRYANQYKLSIITYTLLGLSTIVTGLLSSFVSADMVDIITGQQTGEIVRTFSILIGVALLQFFIGQVSSFFSSKISLRMSQSMKADVFGKILETDLESLQSYHTGDLLTRWSSDVGTISSNLLGWIPNLIIYPVRFLSTLVVVLCYDPIFALLALAGVPVSALLSKTLIGRMRRNNKRSAALSAKISGFNQETFSNIQTIKAFNLLEVYKNRLKQNQKDYFDMQMDFQKMSIGTSFILTITGMVVSYGCYAFGIYRVWSGAISYGTMTLFLSMASSLRGTMGNLTSLVPTAITMSISAERLMDILEMPRETFEYAKEADLLKEQAVESGLNVIFNNFTYRYHTGTQVFNRAQFEAHPNEIVALVGPSGEGKTTMLRLILALLSLQEGEAYVYANNYKDRLNISPSTRRLFSYVPQGNSMFSGTIAENMRNVKEDASDLEIIEALKAACAWDFVNKLPKGINSSVQERGGGFSEGQAQRLSIARALICHAPVLLLDEATSALDIATERKVLKGIMSDKYMRTVIVTTHRPTVLEMCDRVYAIHDRRCNVMTDKEIEKIKHDF